MLRSPLDGLYKVRPGFRATGRISQIGRWPGHRCPLPRNSPAATCRRAPLQIAPADAKPQAVCPQQFAKAAAFVAETSQMWLARFLQARTLSHRRTSFIQPPLKRGVGNASELPSHNRCSRQPHRPNVTIGASGIQSQLQFQLPSSALAPAPSPVPLQIGFDPDSGQFDCLEGV